MPDTPAPTDTPRTDRKHPHENCPTCGHAVRVVSGDEGTSHYEPIEAAATPQVQPDPPAEGLPCPTGCGCRVGTDDSDHADCGCDGPCCWDSWDDYIADVLNRPDYYDELRTARGLPSSLAATPAAKPEAGLPSEALDWARQLVEQGYRDEHIVTFTENGYGLEHPIRCRPNLIGCQFNEWLASQMAPDRDPGRYVMTWGKNGPRYAESAREESKP